MKRWKFYKINILKYLNKNSKILVIGASSREVEIFFELGYINVIFGYYGKKENEQFKNLSSYQSHETLQIDCRKINFPDEHFDYVFTHATIHHIDLPHLAITEMYRVSKFGTLIIESNDSFVMRMAQKFGFTEEFEISSTLKNGQGGLLDTGIPNYVYRWTENEIFKLLNSYKPQIIHKIDFLYANDMENLGLEFSYKKKLLKKTLSKLLYVFFLVFKKQQNLMSIYIDKKKSTDRF